MGKKKVKNKRKTELRLIFFIILVAAALFIISTYAWFSTQKNVSITNLSGIVEVAEGLEISLDAEIWANEIVLGENMNIIDNAYEGHRNISPKELLPVSTLGLTDAKKDKDLTMLRGTVTNSIILKDIMAMDESLVLAEQEDETVNNTEEADYPGYFAFDIFLKNSSKKDLITETLQLNYDSSVQVLAVDDGGNEAAGLQNTVRVALARYGDETTGVVSADTSNQATILGNTGASADGEDVYITDTAIWEPNSSDHVETIVNNNNKITWSATDGPKYGTLNNKTGFYEFGLVQQMPTYALKNSAIGTTIQNIYKWDGTETAVAKQFTLQTTNKKTTGEGGVVSTDYHIEKGVENLLSTKDGKTEFQIPANKIVRLRVYVWLEGQDVDCINYASYGGGVIVNLGLVKGSTPGTFGEAEEGGNT